MPGRQTVLATGEIYHIFNRGNAHQPIFINKRDYQHFSETLAFYLYQFPPLRLSKFSTLSKKRRCKILKKLSQKKAYLVEIVCLCLMPNHFHLLTKQSTKNGISKFMSQLQNSYTKYFNIKRKRVGSLFQGQFRAKRIETEEQLIHLSRYIHLNPYSSFIVKTTKQLKTYSYSSLPDYLGKKNYPFLQKELILDLFKNKKSYQDFVFNQADYQRELAKIKHLTLEN